MQCHASVKTCWSRNKMIFNKRSSRMYQKPKSCPSHSKSVTTVNQWIVSKLLLHAWCKYRFTWAAWGCCHININLNINISLNSVMSAWGEWQDTSLCQCLFSVLPIQQQRTSNHQPTAANSLLRFWGFVATWQVTCHHLEALFYLKANCARNMVKVTKLMLWFTYLCVPGTIKKLHQACLEECI